VLVLIIMLMYLFNLLLNLLYEILLGLVTRIFMGLLRVGIIILVGVRGRSGLTGRVCWGLGRCSVLLSGLLLC